MAESGVGSDRIYRCRVCSEAWQGRGDDAPANCPGCGASRISSTAVIPGAADYVLAERGKGHAIEDIRFGKIAQWTGLISANQYQGALAIQRAAASRERPVEPLGDILVRQGALTKKEVQAVLAVRGRAWHNAAEEALGQLAVSKKLLAEKQLLACKKAQMAIADNGRTPPPLPLILYERRLLPEARIEALVQAQARRNRGLAQQVQEEIAARPSMLTRALGASGTRQRHVRLAGLAALLPVALIALGLYSMAGSVPRVEAQCKECTEISAAPLNSNWPITCTNCSAEAVFPRAICVDCGYKFIVPSPGARGIQCPSCGSDHYRLLTPGVEEKVIEGLKTGGGR